MNDYSGIECKWIEKYLFKSRNKKPVECAELIIKKNIFNMPPFKIVIGNNQKINWHDENIDSRSLLRLLNGLTFIGDLVDAYKITANDKYIKKATELILKWMCENDYEIVKGTMAFHDETTSLRMEYLLEYYISAIGIIDNETLESIYNEIKFTANLLASEDFHTKNTNHGMFQDFALLKYSMLNLDEKCREYQLLSIRRLEEYFEYVYTCDGIHKEHSPSYHLLVTSYMKKYRNILMEYDKHFEFNRKFRNIIENAEKYIIYLTKPNGKLPNIGDTESRLLKDTYPTLFGSEEYKYVVSKGEKGRGPKQKDIVFKDSGYAIFRDDWSKKENMSQVIFTAAYHTCFHKHTDDLNVLFYSGEDILVEAGPNGYNYKNPFTKYAYSAYAHNTLNVINKQLPRHDEKYEKVKMTDYYICDEYSMAEGINRRYKNTVHKRNVKYYNESNTLEVYDEIESCELNQYRLNWHFASGLELIRDNDNILILKNNVEIGIVKITSNVNFQTNIVKGREGRSLQGWYFDKMESKMPINNLEVVFEGKNVKFITQIIIYKDNFNFYKNYVAKNEKIHMQCEKVKYLLKEYEESKKLCIIFSAMGPKNKFVYNYMDTLKECNVNQLYILDEFDIQGSYYLGKEKSFDIESTVLNLIIKVINKLKIKYEDVILIGSSKGGYSALYYGIKYNFGYVIAGAPQSKLGEFLISEANHLEVAKYIAGGIEEEQRIYLNNLLFKTIEENSNSMCNVNIHIGQGDSHYKNHVIPLIEQMNIYGIKNKINLERYNTHEEVKIYFPPYIKSLLNRIDNNIISKEKIVTPFQEKVQYFLKHDDNKIVINVTGDVKKYKFAYYVFNNDICILKQMYCNSSKFEYSIKEEGVYRIRIFKKSINNTTESVYTKYINVKNIDNNELNIK